MILSIIPVTCWKNDENVLKYILRTHDEANIVIWIPPGQKPKLESIAVEMGQHGGALLLWRAADWPSNPKAPRFGAGIRCVFTSPMVGCTPKIDLTPADIIIFYHFSKPNFFNGTDDFSFKTCLNKSLYKERERPLIVQNHVSYPVLLSSMNVIAYGNRKVGL